MKNTSTCCQEVNWSKRRRKFQDRKLSLLTFIRDSYERKLAAVNASIEKLNEQMNYPETETETET